MFITSEKKHSFELGEHGSNSGDKQQCLRAVVTARTVVERRSGFIWGVMVKASYSEFVSGLRSDYYRRRGDKADSNLQK